MVKKNKDTTIQKPEQNYSELEQFIDKLGAAGVSRDNLILIGDRIRYEQARATEEAAKIYIKSEWYDGDKEFPVGDMLSILSRRANGVYAAMMALRDEVGGDNVIYEGAAQIAFDLSVFAHRVCEGYSATSTVKWAKRNGVA